MYQRKLNPSLNYMKTKLLIKNKKLKTSILIKKNYTSKFIETVAKKMKKYFVLQIQKLKLIQNLGIKKI